VSIQFDSASQLLTEDGSSFATADPVRKCDTCKQHLSRTFEIPNFWWTPYAKRSPGFFGSNSVRDDQGKIVTYNTWCRFQAKQLVDDDYHWYKHNILTSWQAKTRQTALLIFDYHNTLIDKVHEYLLDLSVSEGRDQLLMNSPLWPYIWILNDISHLQNGAVWEIRNRVRDDVEKARIPRDRPNKPEVDYPGMHDLARHAIHVSETLDLTVKTAKMILSAHETFMDDLKTIALSSSASTTGGGEDGGMADDIPAIVALGGARNVHEKLLNFEHFIESNRQRSASNKARLANEIQLTFHMSAEYDSRTSVDIAKATRSDSADMRTVAFLTLAFLPATFISAIFSTSFFNFDQNTGEWVVSKQIWIYFAFAAPATVGTTLIWYFFNRLQQRLGGMEAQERKEKEVVKRSLRETLTNLTYGENGERPKDGGELA